ncbi:MAG: hypothetical protein ABSH46_05700 [Bryobacteraceae bacterium]|jgi:hypothetical protein
MRTILLLAFALPLLAQEPPAATPTPTPTPTPEAAPAATPAPAPADNWLTGTLDVGWRFTTGVAGDYDTYRSVVNLRSGPRLFGGNFTIQPAKNRWVDRIDVSVNSWGGDPYNTARVDARKEGLYEFTFDYRNIAYFNFLPSFANPGTVNNALPFLDQYGFDITRRTSDFRLDLFPGHRIIPYVAFSRNGGRGDGTIDFTVQSNEYTVPTNYSDYTNEYRAGVRLEFNRWHLTLEQGGYTSENNQALQSNSPVPNPGNVLTPILGQQLFLTSGAETYAVRGDGLFSRALFTANPVPWADISAQFLYSQLHMTANFAQANLGNFIDLSIPAFFSSESSVIDALAKQPHPAGSASIELKPWHGKLRILESWMTDQLHDAGSALLMDQLLLSGQGASGGTQVTLSALDIERFVATYNQQETDLLFDVTPMLTLRGGYRYVWGSALEPASITVEGSTGASTESGTLRRSVGIGGVTFRTKARFRATIDFEGSPGDRSYFLTSLNDYQRGRAMARYTPMDGLELTGQFSVLDNHNPGLATGYSLLSRDNTLGVSWSPERWKGFGLGGDYTRSTIRSNISYIVPNDFATAISDYRENAHTGTLLADIPAPHWKIAPKVSFGGSLFRSSGSRPTNYYQPVGRVAFPIGEHAQFYGEWRWYSLSQPFYMYEGFQTHQVVTGIRWTM